jgi:hypothetical protein
VPNLADHLQVVVLVADGEALGKRYAETAGQPADAEPLRDARGKELQEARMAQRDLGPAGEVRPS